jgi:SAM-dependent methyltransferase
MIETLADIARFRERRCQAWARNVDYWLRGPLRHVVDVGDQIVGCVQRLCRESTGHAPAVVDMGCGDAWLLGALRDKRVQLSYRGIDSNAEFLQAATEKYGALRDVAFILADVETRVDLPVEADVVVNAFNFFELDNLEQAMANVQRWLRPNGMLFMSTIDKTYLMLALSRDWSEFHENLSRYQKLPGVKYGFQKIDLGAGVSDHLEYPSVLYSTQDYIETARAHGMHLVDYVERPFTSATVPKIYCHLEFRRK